MARQGFDPSANRLVDLIAGHRVTAIIYTAAKLGIADLVLEGPKSAAELARLSDTHPQSLLRLAHALVALDIFKEEDGTFELTEMGQLLAAGSQRPLKPWALMEGEMLRPGWNGLIESVRTGNTANELAGLGQERYERLAETNQAALFNEGIASVTSMALPPVLEACDFSGIATLVDVGGGLGELMSAAEEVSIDARHCVRSPALHGRSEAQPHGGGCR